MILLALWLSLPAISEAQTLQFLGAGQAAGAVLERSHPQIQLTDPASNLDPTLAESVSATVASLSTGDSETVVLRETAADTGRFAGRFQLVADSSAARAAPPQSDSPSRHPRTD